MRIINNIYKDISKLINIEELLCSSSIDREWIIDEIKRVFNLNSRIVDVHGKVRLEFINNYIIDEVMNNYIGGPLESHMMQYLERDFILSTGVHTKIDFTDTLNLSLDTDYYNNEYILNSIEVVNPIGTEYFKYKFGEDLTKYPVVVREYMKRTNKIAECVDDMNRILSNSNRTIFDVIKCRQTICKITETLKESILFKTECRMVDDDIIRITILPTQQFKKMYRKIDKPYKTTVRNESVTIKFENCTPLLSKDVMYELQGMVDWFNTNKTEKYVPKSEYVNLIGLLFKFIENKNSKSTASEFYIKYWIDFYNLSNITIGAKYFLSDGNEINIFDDDYEELVNYKMYESPTLRGLLLRNRKTDFEDAMYLIRRYNRTHRVQYDLYSNILMPKKVIFQEKIIDNVNDYVRYMFGDRLTVGDRPESDIVDINMGSNSWRFNKPTIKIKLK